MLVRLRLVTFALALSMLAIPPSLHAQDTPSTAPATTVVVVAPAAASAPVEEPADDPVRFRFGISLGADLLAAPTTLGLAVDLTVRLGVQFNQWVGLYYQPHGLAGGWLGDGAAGVIAGLYNSVLAELTLPFVHIGAGPSADVLAVAGCGGSGCLSGDAVFFGIDTRLALVIGGVGRGSRGGLSIAAHVHPTFVGDSVVTTITLGVGGELY